MFSWSNVISFILLATKIIKRTFEINEMKQDMFWKFCFFKILTKDSVTVAVDAVVYFRIHNATMSITNVENANRSTRLLAQTTLRNVLGTKSLSEILTERDIISHIMQVQFLTGLLQ
jgi:regulator of protease activity HflC (stomatin/prohibitin superfamily)